MRRTTSAFVLAWGLFASLAGVARAALPPDLPLPPLEELALEGVAWLVGDQAAHVAELPPAERAAALRTLFADPDPATPANELLEGIRRRRALVLSETLTITDVRARLLFLHGAPARRERVDCDVVFKTIEVWTYGNDRLVLYRPQPWAPFKLWLPGEGKGVLYTREMEGILEDFGGRERIDRRLCKSSEAVDLASGIDGLRGHLPGAPDNRRLLAMLAPPSDLAAWAREAAAEPLSPIAPLDVKPFQTSFPRQQGQRIEARLLLVIPAGTALQPALMGNVQGEERKELRLSVDGVVELGGELFEPIAMRFAIPLTEVKPGATVLAVPVLLRPAHYVVRLRIRDEVSGAMGIVSGTVDVPAAPQPPPPDDVVAIDPSGAKGGGFDRAFAPGADTGDVALKLIVPPQEVLFDNVRAQAMVRDERIQKVSFLLDGAVQLTRATPPWTVEMKLARIPREQVLRAEGYDSSGALVAGDTVVINQLRGQLAVRIVSPPARKPVVGETRVRAELVVPEDRHVESVEVSVNGEQQAKLSQPPWEAKVRVPDEALTYVTVTATLDDGSRAESVRFLATPPAMAEEDVRLVELYTTVTDSSGAVLRGLAAADFEVREDGRPQKLARAELAEDLPLFVGVALDVSGSMQQALGEAQRSAGDFLRNLVRSRDLCFAVAFSTRPTLVAPRTSNPETTARTLAGLRAEGSTSLYDALVLSLYYFRGNEGRRALVVLSDGGDTDSVLSFDDALEYARESGVVIYTVGMKTDDLDFIARHHLQQLAEATGGRGFVIARAEELAGVYRLIESELRSQYVLAYAPPNPGKGGFRRVEVKVKRGGATARTRPGYVP